MKNKVLSAILCVIMLFSIFSIFVFAADSAVPTTLKEEIQNNFPDLDLTDFTKNREAAFIGLSSTCETNLLKLYIYVYSSEFEQYSSDTVYDYYRLDSISFGLYSYDSSDMLEDSFEESDAPMMLKSMGEGFAKYEIILLPTFSFTDGYFKIYIDEIIVGDKTLILDVFYKVVCNSDLTNDVEYDVSEDVHLQVYSTDYRTKSTDTKYDYDNIVSFYFSIPQKYQDWYDYLYSVTCQMLKRRTKPIFVSNIVDITPEEAINTSYYAQRVNQWLAEKYVVSEDGYLDQRYEGTPTLVSTMFYKAPQGAVELSENTDFGSYADFAYSGDAERLYTFDLILCDPDAESFYDIDISGEVLENYVKTYGENADLFVDKEYNKYVTKTINDKWDSLDYSYSADFFDFWRDFGFFEAFKYLWLKDDETKLYEYFEKHGINPDGYNFKDEPFLVKVDEAVLGDLSNLEAEAFCDKYAIGYDDYEHFKKFAQENENVVIYRIDVDSYISMPVKTYEPYAYTGITGTYENVRTNEDKAMGIVQTCVYEDVEVIDITMSRNGEYHSLKTSSNIVNIYPDLEGIKPESGMPSNGDFWKGMGGFLVNVLTGYDPNDADDKPSWLKTLLLIINIVLIVIAIIVVIYIITLIVKLVNQARMGRYLRQQNKKNE